MKKSLLAFAVVSAFASAGAQAQTSVTLYGVADVGFVRESGGAAGSVTKLSTGAMSGSRFGLRGSEDLGGGLKANFVAETGYCADSNSAAGFCTGGNNFMGRRALVGVSGGFGTIGLGRDYTPHFNVLGNYDPFGTGLAGSSANVMFTRARANNSFNYSLPDLGGVVGEFQYGFGEVAGSSSAGRWISGNVGYATGPFSAHLGFGNLKSANPADLTSTDAKSTIFGISYDLGVVKPSFVYDSSKTTTQAGATDLDRREMLIGATAPLGAGELMVSYVRRDDRSVANADTNQVGVGYTYSLSKRTNVYTAYARTKKAANGSVIATVGNATDDGSGNSGLNIGVRHKF